jgi:hypothetical protein
VRAAVQVVAANSEAPGDTLAPCSEQEAAWDPSLCRQAALTAAQCHACTMAGLEQAAPELLRELPAGTPGRAEFERYSNTKDLLAHTHANTRERTRRTVCGWLAGWMAGWLDGWMAGWLGGWVVPA